MAMVVVAIASETREIGRRAGQSERYRIVAHLMFLLRGAEIVY